MTEEEFVGVGRRFYRIASGPCWDACKAYRDRIEAVETERRAYTASIGAAGHYPGATENVGNARSINAVIFEGVVPKGWKVNRRSNWKGLNSGQRAAQPDKRTGAGKDAIDAIAKLPLGPSPDRVCKDIGFPTSITYEQDGHTGYSGFGLFETARIGWLKDVFYVSLPDFVVKKAKMIAEGYAVSTPDWSPLPGMEDILKEEMQLDFAKARMATATAGASA